jgi:flagellar biosynthesis/type III secretory pathway protein FliH
VQGGRSPEEHRLACLEPIAQAEIDDARRLLLANCVETYVQLNEAERESYETLLDREENREVAVMERTLLTTLDRAAQRGYDEGLTAGERKGKREGREQGKRELLLDLLGHRFGPLPDATVERVQALTSPEELARLAERVLDARSLDDLGL